MDLELGIRMRPLRREPHAHNTNFRALAYAYHAELAEQCLAVSMRVKEIGFLLGLVDTNSFRGGFRAWTGAPIGEFWHVHRQSPG